MLTSKLMKQIVQSSDIVPSHVSQGSQALIFKHKQNMVNVWKRFLGGVVQRLQKSFNFQLNAERGDSTNGLVHQKLLTISQ